MKRERPSEEEPELIDEKAFGSVRVRMSEDLKTKLRSALKTDPNFAGNVSEFVNECARAYVLQRRKGQHPAYPVEFVLETAAME